MNTGMKKILSCLSLMLLLLCVTGGGTYAYISARVDTTNVITTGDVDLEIVETCIDKEGAEQPYPEEPVSGVVPGMVLSKIPRLRNTGSQPAWMRVKMEILITDSRGEYLPSDNIHIDINTAYWQKASDGWLYYYQPVRAQDLTEPLFWEVTFDEEMDNRFQSCTVDIRLQGQAVQEKNNQAASGKASDVKGWPGE